MGWPRKFAYKTKYNPSAEIANNALCHNYKHWLDIKESPLASTAHMWPEHMSCAYFPGPSSYRKIGWLHSLGGTTCQWKHKLPLPLGQTSYAMERKTDLSCQ